MRTFQAGTKFVRETGNDRYGEPCWEVITITEVDPEDPTEGHITIEAGIVNGKMTLLHDFWTTLTSSEFIRTIRDFEEVE